MQEVSDEQLVVLARDTGNSTTRQQAVEELFGRYQARVATWCYRVARDRELASDLAQEVFLRALRSLSGFRGDAKFSTWLYTIARNHCYNALKDRSSRAEESIEFLEIPDPGRAVDDEMEAADEIWRMRQLLNKTLCEVERHVMTLHYGEGMTLDSVTQLLGLRNSSGAKAYVVSAKRKLQAAIQRLKAQRVHKAEN